MIIMLLMPTLSPAETLYNKFTNKIVDDPIIYEYVLVTSLLCANNGQDYYISIDPSMDNYMMAESEIVDSEIKKCMMAAAKDTIERSNGKYYDKFNKLLHNKRIANYIFGCAYCSFNGAYFLTKNYNGKRLPKNVLEQSTIKCIERETDSH